MFPHEAEMLMAKVLLIVFATFALCYAKANAAELNNFPKIHSAIVFEIQT
jgi:hypothetical protein